MRILRYLSVIFIIIFNETYGQFFWSNPTIQNNTLRDVHLFDQFNAIAVGEVGTILRTTNAGLNWSVVHLAGGNYYELTSIHFLSTTDGIVCGQNGVIMKTTDSGNSWSNVASNVSTYLRKIAFVYPSYYWIAGEGGVILFSSDGGNSFSKQNSGISTNLNSIYFIDASRGFAVGDGGVMLRTFNGGVTWSKVILPSTVNKSLNAIQFPTLTRGYAVGDSGMVIRSTDSGLNWFIIGVADTNIITTSDLRTVYFLDENRGYVAGDESRIFYTSNGGTTRFDWQFQLSPTWRHIYSLKFANQYFGYAVGDWGIILTTTDGGAFWQARNLGNDEYLNRIWFVNRNVGWVVGDRGIILKTTNGGVTWLKVPVMNAWNQMMTADINAIQFLDEYNGFAVGDSGYFSYTTNGGREWYFYHYDISNHMDDLWGLDFLDSYNGIVVGGYWSQPVYLKTTDRGQSWNIFRPSDRYDKSVPLDVDMIDYNKGWACGRFDGGGGNIRFTNNGGFSWTYLDPPFFNDWLYKIHFVNHNIGYSCGKVGKAFKTTNGGLDWYPIYPPTNKELFSIHFADEFNGMIVGEDGLILASTDSGATWRALPKMTNNRLKSVFMIDANNVFVVGERGTILKSTNGGATFVDFSDIFTQDFVLKQNYPNPFNSITDIEFILNKSSNVNLIVYNSIGQKVTTLLNEFLSAGEHTIKFKTSLVDNLSSGIYFITLKTETNQKTIKAVLLK